jgi:hypothetical protein
MKLILAMAILLVGFNANSSECNTYEAQVFGTIHSVKKIQDVCFYKVSIDSISEHGLCPLTKTEIEEAFVQYEAGFHESCLYRFGGEFSGILVKDRNDVITFD